jgi:hypothetical protein
VTRAALVTSFISLIIIVSNNITTLYITKLGVLGGIYQRISYDLETNVLSLSNISAAAGVTDSGGSFSSQQASQSQFNK